MVDHTAYSSWMVAAVCVNGRGPLPFVVDTGASESIIDSRPAASFGLGPRGSTVSVHSFGCTSKVSFAEVNNWSAGGVPLPAGPVLVGDISSPEVPALAGLLGSDFLSDFGAARFDFAAHTLTLGQLQQAAQDSTEGSTDAPTIAATLTAGTSIRVPMTVSVHHTLVPVNKGVEIHAVRATVPVEIGGYDYAFAVDTGAARTIISPDVAEAADLTNLHEKGTAYAGLSCRVAVSHYLVPHWSVHGVAFGAQTVGSNQVPGTLDGLLGSGTLQRHTPIVVDYIDGELLLGTGG
jgi:predicted aspartyl protease